MRTKKELLDMLRDYVADDYNELIRIAQVNDDEYQEIIEERDNIFENIDDEIGDAQL